MNTPWQAHHGDFFKNQRVLVTGAAGFIGSHLVQALGLLGARIVALDDLSNGHWSILDGFDSGVTKITASILDSKALDEAAAGCAYVFHQAALGSVPRSLEEPDLYQQVNANGTLNVLLAARKAGVRRVMYAGSSSAYGDPPDQGPKVETMPALPRSPYAAAKLAGEHLMQAWFHSYGLDTAITRYFNIFGPRQNANSAYAAVIAAFAKALLAGRRPLIFGDGGQTRDFTFVHNAVHANLLAARCPRPTAGRVFNTATGSRISILRLFELMAAELGHPGMKPDFQPARAGDVLHSLADISLARRELGYEPLVDFDAGLTATVTWYRDHLKGR